MTDDALFELDPPAAATPGFELAAPKRQRRAPHPYAHLATKHPDGIRATWCATCKAPVVAGLDNLVCALDARVDAVPLTPLGEALAVLGGRTTYELRTGKPPRIVRRTAQMILARPAGATTRRAHAAYDVVAAHQCHAVAAGPLAGASTLQQPATTRVLDATSTPPF